MVPELFIVVNTPTGLALPPRVYGLPCSLYFGFSGVIRSLCVSSLCQPFNFKVCNLIKSVGSGMYPEPSGLAVAVPEWLLPIILKRGAVCNKVMALSSSSAFM